MHQLNAMEKKSLPSHIRNYRHGNIRVYNYIVTVMTVTVMMFSCLALCQERCAWQHVMPASAVVACSHIHA